MCVCVGVLMLIRMATYRYIYNTHTTVLYGRHIGGRQAHRRAADTGTGGHPDGHYAVVLMGIHSYAMGGRRIRREPQCGGKEDVRINTTAGVRTYRYVTCCVLWCRWYIHTYTTFVRAWYVVLYSSLVA